MTKTGNSSTAMPKAKIWRTAMIDACEVPETVVTETVGADSRLYPSRRATNSSMTVLVEPVSKIKFNQRTLCAPVMRTGTTMCGALRSKRNPTMQNRLPTFRDSWTCEKHIDLAVNDLGGIPRRFSVREMTQQDAFFGQTIFVVGSDLDEQPLTFVTTADLFNGFGANFVHLPSPAKIVALKSVQACMGVSVLAAKAERLHSHTLARLHTCTLKRKRRDDA
jgi:hypothetical protein